MANEIDTGARKELCRNAYQRIPQIWTLEISREKKKMPSGGGGGGFGATITFSLDKP